jgi:Domain of unknown function (DUF385).
MLADVVDEEYAYLTTGGRVSGEPHEIEIWFATDGSTAWLISGAHDRSDWVRNLLARASARLRIGAVILDVHARCAIVDPVERERVARMLHDKYARQVSAAVEEWIADAYLVALDPA